MAKYGFIIDVERCNGCYNCQIACKDEHCGNDRMPYAKAQPDTGQFWCRVEEDADSIVRYFNLLAVAARS